MDRLHAEIQRLFAQGARNDLDTTINTWLGGGGLTAGELPGPGRCALHGRHADRAHRDRAEPDRRLRRLDRRHARGSRPQRELLRALPGPGQPIRPRASPGRPRSRRHAPAAARAAGCAYRRPTSGPPPRGRMRSCCWRTATSSRATASTSSTRCWPAGMRSSARSTGSRPATPTPVPAAGCSTPRSTTTARGSATTPNRQSGPPALIQALRAERERYLADGQAEPTSSRPRPRPGSTRTGASISRSTASICSTRASFRDLRSDNGRFTIPSLRATPRLVTWLPAEVLNGVRLGVAGVRVTWSASCRAAHSSARD